MVTQLTLQEILGDAIQKEVLSRFLYIVLRQRVKDKASAATILIAIAFGIPFPNHYFYVY